MQPRPQLLQQRRPTPCLRLPIWLRSIPWLSWLRWRLPQLPLRLRMRASPQVVPLPPRLVRFPPVSLQPSHNRREDLHLPSLRLHQWACPV